MKQRLKFYRKALTNNHECDKEAYRSMDKWIKKRTRINRGERKKTYINRVVQAKPKKLGKLYNKILSIVSASQGRRTRRT